MSRQTRGLRNNNPMNIEKSANKWQGKVKGTDSRFESFSSMVMGIRAGAVLLQTYGDKGYNSVSKVLRRFAPAKENNTVAYIKSVCSYTGFKATEVLDLDSYDTMLKLIKAIIEHENYRGASNEIKQADYDKALHMAGVHGTPSKPVLTSDAGKAATATAATGTVALVGKAIDTASPAIPLVQDIIYAAPWVIGVALLALAAYLVYKHIQKQKAGEVQ